MENKKCLPNWENTKQEFEKYVADLVDLWLQENQDAILKALKTTGSYRSETNCGKAGKTIQQAFCIELKRRIPDGYWRSAWRSDYSNNVNITITLFEKGDYPDYVNE